MVLIPSPRQMSFISARYSVRFSVPRICSSVYLPCRIGNFWSGPPLFRGSTCLWIYPFGVADITCATACDVPPWKMPLVLHDSGGGNAESRVARLGGASGVKREGDAKPMLRKAVVLDAPRGPGRRVSPRFFPARRYGRPTCQLEPSCAADHAQHSVERNLY